MEIWGRNSATRQKVPPCSERTQIFHAMLLPFAGHDDNDDGYAVDTNDHRSGDNDNMQNCGQLFCTGERACV